MYASSKRENNYFGFGTDNDMETTAGYVVIKHRTFRGSGAPTAAHAHEESPTPVGARCSAGRADGGTPSVRARS